MSAALRPADLALIVAQPVESLAGLMSIAERVLVFPDTDALLVSDKAYEHDFYVVGGSLGAPDGLALVRLIRRRSDAGLVVWHGRAPGAAWLDAGADAWLSVAATEADLRAAVLATYRRTRRAASHPDSSGPPLDAGWRLDVAAASLWPPTGAEIRLSEADVRVLSCFLEAPGQVVKYERLLAALGHEDGAGADNWLQASMYRLRRRIERSTEGPAPLVSKARVGYLFQGRLTGVGAA